MALSTYSNMGALENLGSEMNTPFQVQPREAELLSYSNTFDLPNTFLHPLYDPNYNTFIHQEDDDTDTDYDLLLPYLSEILTPQDSDPYSYPKRQKCYGNEYFSDFTPTFFDGFLPDFFSPMPDYRNVGPGAGYCTQQVDHHHHHQCSTKMINERSVSAQSVAARERRKKITEKTQELGGLIPGGTRLNTAEMFHAASKYVKYLQAQVGILQLMGSFQEIYEASPREELQVILASPSVQEKLYLEDKCLVPKELAKVLAKHCDIQSKPSISNDLNQLVRSED